MIICQFSASYFATQISPIDDLLKPYNWELLDKYYIHLGTYNVCRVFIVFIWLLLQLCTEVT
jgi:hypothetical protein